MRRALILLAIVALSACRSQEQVTADEIKAVVAATMKDPVSSTFSALRLDGELLCGEVNSKNSFGAYAGAEQFWATKYFLEIRAEAVARDQVLKGTPAAAEWKQSAGKFDKTWGECQKKGVPVE